MALTKRILDLISRDFRKLSKVAFCGNDCFNSYVMTKRWLDIILSNRILWTYACHSTQARLRTYQEQFTYLLHLISALIDI